MSLPDVVHRFKSLTTTRYRHGVIQNRWQPFPGRLWQRNYYEQIIRDEDELNRLRQYIVDNPANWATDEENPNRLPGHPLRAYHRRGRPLCLFLKLAKLGYIVYSGFVEWRNGDLQRVPLSMGLKRLISTKFWRHGHSSFVAGEGSPAFMNYMAKISLVLICSSCIAGGEKTGSSFT